jgi:hypothetical protein
LYNTGCKINGDPVTNQDNFLSTFRTNTPQGGGGGGDGSGFQTFDVAIELDPRFIDSMDSNVYSEVCDGSFDQVRMCVRCQLHTPKDEENGGDVEVNFRENQIVYNIDLQGSTDLGVSFIVQNPVRQYKDNLNSTDADVDDDDDWSGAGVDLFSQSARLRMVFLVSLVVWLL